ncbi:DUF427 domain-containing protein [Nocardioides sp. Leaf307]|uniref:DUF427 domain-containing protein n=1 Tax=Nocardioides sp. Leaf307 TaxID=1736331 RepID=UPI000702FDC4|nr:DUF427 domain-containing protein [Nocardioides sp. Leaf307]KQQ42055.1 hypothetical protein ASF50_14450 [Nocardioides sp. Leaf307]
MSTRPVKVPDASHPISVTATGQPVTVSVDGHVVARTDAALSLAEAGYPPVQYVPIGDVDPLVLTRTEHATYCPYKGEAAYYSLVVGGRTLENKVWTYDTPYPAVAEIAGHVAFYPDVVDVRVG